MLTCVRSRQRGVALVVALLVVALATILVAALLDRGELALARTRNALRAEQAEAYAQGLEAYAMQVLMLRNDADTAMSPWAQPMPPQVVPGGLVTASMRDLNGCFNLNNLDPVHRQAWQPVFRRLLAALGADQGIDGAIENWLDPAQADAASANAYLAQAVPYRPRGGLFAHVSELRLVRGIDGATYARLAPHVCALPPGTRINLNTATVPLLQALLGNGETPATLAAAQKLWQNGQARWSDPTAFWNAAGVPAPATLAALVGTHSSAFLARGDIVLDGVPFTVFRLILAPPQGRIEVVQRSRGADEALLGAAPIDADDSAH